MVAQCYCLKKTDVNRQVTFINYISNIDNIDYVKHIANNCLKI